MKLTILLATSALCLASCATLNGVPQTPCQRATRAIDTARLAVNVAATAGADPVIIAKLSKVVDDAQIVASAACAQANPGTP